MEKNLLGKIQCKKCNWVGTISDCKSEWSEFLDETQFHECPNCGAQLVMETEYQIRFSSDALRF